MATVDDVESQALLFEQLKTPKEVFRDIRNYLAGQFVGATRDDTLLDEVLKCLFCKLYIETSASEPLPQNNDAFKQAQHIRNVFANVRLDFPDIYDKDDEIALDPEAIRYVMGKCYFSLLDAASDPIGDAFEVFVGAESRGRAGQFFTPRTVTDLLVSIVNPQPGETIIDPACGAGGFLASVARHFLGKERDIEKLSKLESSTFYGIDKDAYVVKLARLHVSLLSRSHPHVYCADSIALQNGIDSFPQFPEEGFDVLLANPPFGTRIVAAKPEVLKFFELARKWRADAATGVLKPTGERQANVPPQVLFVERCLSLLKPGGRLGMVLPESVLSNKSYRYVVQYLLDNAIIQAVIGMPESLFKTSGKGGTHTKTCLLVAKKSEEKKKKTTRIFMAEARWCGYDSRARSIPYNDLPTIRENFDKLTKNKKLEESTLGFLIDESEIKSNVLCPRYYDPQIDQDLKGLEETHDLRRFGDLVESEILSVSTGDELGKLAYGTGAIPFIRTSDISNWELKADPKHGVDRSYYDSMKKKQDVRANDLLMVKDGTYLIGTCALITEYDTEIIYQSHLYKIRVQDNKIGLTSFLLLAVLGCQVVQRQIRAKQFTQDIIDSLGERINELILPIPKLEKKRDQITEMVQTSIRRRVEARELAKEARLAVAPTH